MLSVDEKPVTKSWDIKKGDYVPLEDDYEKKFNYIKKKEKFGSYFGYTVLLLAMMSILIVSLMIISK